MDRRKWIVVGGIAASILVGGAAYVWSRSRKSLPAPSYVGQPGYVWPRGDLFLDMSGFGEALESMGYDVGDWSSPDWNVLDEVVRSAVSEFQADWNVVATSLDTFPVRDLDVTGTINSPTVEALAFVNSMQDAGHTWPLIVLEVREGLS